MNHTGGPWSQEISRNSKPPKAWQWLPSIQTGAVSVQEAVGVSWPQRMEMGVGERAGTEEKAAGSAH